MQAIIQLGPQHRHVLIADVLTHRLEVWERGTDPADSDLQRRLSVRMVLGTGGVGKVADGDRRTPLGAYRVVALRQGRSLPVDYGPLAWVLDYPNAWDRAAGRSGSGIWLHGTRGNQSPRRSSTGCIVVRNSDLQAVHRLLGDERPWLLVVAARPSRTPEGTDTRTVRALVSAWQRATLLGQAEGVAALYAAAQEQRPAPPVPSPVSISNISAFALPGRWVVDFTASDGLGEQRRTQHWMQVDGQWKIAAEGVIE